MSNYIDGFLTGGFLVAITALLIIILVVLLRKDPEFQEERRVKRRLKAVADSLNESTQSLASSSGKVQDASATTSGIEPETPIGPQGQGE